MREALMTAALAAKAKAYAPYSGFCVGAAVLSRSGRIFAGCNIENASYGLSICAERTAIFKAVSEGETALQALAVAADGDLPATPCGACRQVMIEFGINEVIMCNAKKEYITKTLAELLPYSFSKARLTGDDRL